MSATLSFDAEDMLQRRTSTGSPATFERFGAGLLLSTALILSPAVGTSCCYAAPTNLHALAAGAGTGIGGFASLEDIRTSFGIADQPIATAPVVRHLHEVSGLTWAELARLFGVSRRAVHGWATGARMNAAHAARLSRLVDFFATVDTGDRDTTRALVIAPNASGESEYQRLLAALPSRETTQGRIHYVEGLRTRADEPPSDPHVIAIDHVD